MSARAGRTLAATGIVVSAACVTLLHLLRTDLPPLAHRLSEYATGPYGWLMTLAFVALAAGLAGFAVFLWATNEKFGASMALIAAVATVVSAAFPTNVSKASEAIHSPASTAAVLALLALAVIHTLGTGVGRAEPVFAGEPAQFRLYLDGRAAFDRPAILVASRSSARSRVVSTSTAPGTRASAVVRRVEYSLSFRRSGPLR